MTIDQINDYKNNLDTKLHQYLKKYGNLKQSSIINYKIKKQNQIITWNIEIKYQYEQKNYKNIFTLNQFLNINHMEIQYRQSNGQIHHETVFTMDEIVLAICMDFLIPQISNKKYAKL